MEEEKETQLNNDITIITAFFNVRRDTWEEYNRSEDLYFSYFDFWARIRNKVIVYVETEEHAIRVKQIREKYNRENVTDIIVTGECEKLDKALYDSIVYASNSNGQQECHLKQNNPESWSSKYNYVMMLKTFCVNDAIERGITSDICAWIDFGYGHGKQSFASSVDFDFEWKYNFVDKLNLFAIKPIDKKPLIYTIMSMDTYITGAVQVGPSENWRSHWKNMRSSMISLNKIGLMDDDQSIMLISFFENPDNYCVLPSEEGFFEPIRKYGGNHIRVNRTSKKRLIDVFKRNTKKKIERIRYILRILKYLNY